MKSTRPFILLLIVTTTSFAVLAEKIYKTVDESGAVVFSDKKTEGAEKNKVKPNVVNVHVPKMPESTPRKNQKRPLKKNKNLRIMKKPAEAPPLQAIYAGKYKM